MSTAWGRDWRKLYRNPSPAWLMLSYSARGLGYEILRVCDDDGRIDCGSADPFEVVVRLCVIGGHKRRAAREDFDALKEDGFLALDGAHLVVRNFRAAQETLSPAAAKKAAQRARAAKTGGEFPTEVRPKSDRSPTQLEPNFAELGLNSAELEPNFAELPSNPAELQPTKEDCPGILDLEETKKRQEEKREEGGAGEEPPSPPAEAKDFQLTASTEKSKRSKKPKAPTADREPPAGSLANSVRAAIVADPALAPIVGNPGDFAMRITEPGAYPGVDALAEVRRAGEFASRSPGKYSDGRAFLSRWLKRAADDYASKPKPAQRGPAPARSPFGSVEEAVAAGKAAKERRAAEAAGGSA